MAVLRMKHNDSRRYHTTICIHANDHNHDHASLTISLLHHQRVISENTEAKVNYGKVFKVLSTVLK